MRNIERSIVSAIIFSKDNKILMGRKDPAKGGVYADCWHIPGGGVDDTESKESALVREVMEETGIDISHATVRLLPSVGTGTAEKVLKETGERVLCHMTFHRYEVHLEQSASNLKLAGNGEFVEMRWFDRSELQEVQQIPGGKEFFVAKGYIQ